MPQSTYVKDKDGELLEINADGSMSTKILDKDGKPLEFDIITTGGTYGYVIQIPIEHHKIHEGDHYVTVDYDNDVDIAGPKYWHIKAPASGYIHLAWRLKSSFNGTVEFFESPTTSADGTALTPRNSDRNSSATATLQAFYDPTVSVAGTRLDVDVIGSDGVNPVGADGGDLHRESEWILKQNTSYLFKFTASTDNARVTIHLSHYEVG